MQRADSAPSVLHFGAFIILAMYVIKAERVRVLLEFCYMYANSFSGLFYRLTVAVTS